MYKLYILSVLFTCRQRDVNIMLDQLRLESYCCCKLRLTTAVAVLGWVGVLVSVLVIVGGILLAVIPPVLSEQFILILPGVILILIWLIPLIINSILIKRNRAGSFSGVKSIIQVICKIFLSLELIVSIILIFSMLAMIALTAVGTNLPGIVGNVINNANLSLTSDERQGLSQLEQIFRNGSQYEDFAACDVIKQQVEAARRNLGEPTVSQAPDLDSAALLRCLKDASPIFMAIFIVALAMALLWMVFLCLAIHGVRKNRKSLLNAYIIFNILLLVGPIALQILSLFTQPEPVDILSSVIPSILGNILVFLYHMGFFVVLYNMMDVSLDYDHEMKRI